MNGRGWVSSTPCWCWKRRSRPLERTRIELPPVFGTTPIEEASCGGAGLSWLASRLKGQPIQAGLPLGAARTPILRFFLYREDQACVSYLSRLCYLLGPLRLKRRQRPPLHPAAQCPRDRQGRWRPRLQAAARVRCGSTHGQKYITAKGTVITGTRRPARI